MRILQITLIFIFFTACQKNTSQNKAPSEVSKTILDGIINYYNIRDFKLLFSEEISLSNIKFILHNFETI